MTDKSWIGGS